MRRFGLLFALALGACGDDPSSTPPAADASVDVTQGDAAAADAGPDATSSTPCLPYDRPPIATLRASPKKVFAHYFAPFPISIDNKPAASDYYAVNYLQPSGENGKFAGQGGFLRDRPLPQDPWPANVDFQEANLELEVKRAISAGLDGFTFDVLSTDPKDVNYLRLTKLLTAIPKVDPEFRVQLVLDMTAGALSKDDVTAEAAILSLLSAVGDDPSLQRLSDKRLVVSAFAAEAKPPAFWIGALAKAKAAGHELAFIPMPVGAFNASTFANVPLYGASSWGTRTVNGAASLTGVPATVHVKQLIWMGPVAPQDSRPKDLIYTEASNSLAFRAQWKAAIDGGADWVQLITWNDYSEDSEVAPSAETHTAFSDLAGYFTTWFKLGAPPPIVRDALYLFHRAHSMDPKVAPPNLAKQTKPFGVVGGAPSEDQIEALALLTAPGTLRITVGATVVSQAVGAGIQSVRIPLTEGTPKLELVRNDVVVATLTSAKPISNAITYQDPLYHAGTSLSCGP